MGVTPLKNTRCNTVYIKIHGGKHCFYTVYINSHTHFLLKKWQSVDFAKWWNFDQNCKFRPNFDQNSKFRPNFVKIWWKLGRRPPKSPGKFLVHTEIYGTEHHFYQICTTVWPKNFTKICKNSKFCKIWKFWSTPFFWPGFQG